MAISYGIFSVVVSSVTALNSAPFGVSRGTGPVAAEMTADAPGAEMTAKSFGADLSRLESLVYTLSRDTKQVVATPEDPAWGPAAGILQARKAPAPAAIDHNATERGATAATWEGSQVEAHASLNAPAAASSSSTTAAIASSLNSSAVDLAALLADRWRQTRQLVTSLTSMVAAQAATSNATSLSSIVTAQAATSNATSNASDIDRPVLALNSFGQMFSSKADRDANAGLIMLVTDVETVVHRSLSPIDTIVSHLPQWIEPWMLLLPAVIITLGISYAVIRQMYPAQPAEGEEGAEAAAPPPPADDDEDWELLDEKRMQKIFGKPCMRGWCCCTCMTLINQCPTSLYLLVFLGGGFYTLWRYNMIQPVLQQLLVYLYMALAIIGIAILIIMNIFAALRRSGRMATKAAEDAVGSLQEGFQALQQGLDNVMDALNPFDDSSGDDSDGSDAQAAAGPPDDHLTLEDFTCGLIPDARPEDLLPVVFNEYDRVKSRDGPGRWYYGFVVSAGRNSAVPLPYSIPAKQLHSPTVYEKMYVHVDNQSAPRRGWKEVKHILKGEPGYKQKEQALKKLKARQHKQTWHGGRLPQMPSLGGTAPRAAPAAAPAAAPGAAPSS